YWDVMSNGAYDIGSIYGEIPTDTISYNKDMAGWIPPGQKFIATPNSSETITLERLDQPTDGGTAFLMAEIPIDADRFYTVEARRFAGYDQGIPGEAVILHEVQPSRTYDALVVDPDGNGDPNDEGAMWRVGETFEDPVNEISVSVDSDTGTGYIVTIARNQSMQEPDLRSTQVSGVPVRLLPGETLTITDTVFNDGPGDVVDAFDVGFFLSINSTIDLNDIFLGSRTVNNLAFGASSQDSTAVVIPPGTPGRLYYLGAIADYADSIAEGDETDNALRGNTITVETPPFVDLTVTAVNGPKSGRIGETITITTTVRNGGNIATVGNFDLGIYLSTDTTITTDDILRALISVGPMAVGESRTFNTDVLIQGFIEPGTYYPGAIADEGDVIVESDETNNAVAGSRIRIK
ncbi:MAG TPA: CARDB domain-containing protein, partial [Nitrospiria bacterium]